MAYLQLLIAISAVFSTAHGAHANRCKTFSLAVSIANITQLVPPFQPFPDDGYAATSFDNTLTMRDPPLTNPKLQSFTGSFNISIQYCTPKINKSNTTQFLTHGIGFDKAYWDFRLPENTSDVQYSYINTALNNGYATFSWDRIGCGLSSAPDPYLVVQTPIELAVMERLTIMLRDGSLTSYGIPKPNKLIHVGHSLGSQLTHALVALPHANKLSDGVILTSFSNIFNYTSLSAAAYNLHIAKTNQPSRFGNHSTGYLTWGDKFANQYAFFAWPHFDPAVLEYAESVKWPVTAGELLTMRLLRYQATTFTGPVLWLAAERDLIFCGSNCPGLFGAGSPALTTFNSSKSVEVYIQPRVGHGMNLHKNATGAFNVAQNWALKHGF